MMNINNNMNNKNQDPEWHSYNKKKEKVLLWGSGIFFGVMMFLMMTWGIKPNPWSVFW
jgi:cytochrome b subunit of formate dehydrogenase